jgi:hypothetical protein
VLRGAARDRVAVATPGPKEYAGEATRQQQVVRLGQVFFFFFFAWAGESALRRNICRSALLAVAPCCVEVRTETGLAPAAAGPRWFEACR